MVACHIGLPGFAGEVKEADMAGDKLFGFQKMDAYQVAKEIARRVHAMGIRDGELRDQATRASKSCFLGLAEGLPNDAPGLRRRYFTQARNSLCETVGALDLAVAIDAADADAVDAVQTLALRLKPMLRALL